MDLQLDKVCLQISPVYVAEVCATLKLVLSYSGNLADMNNIATASTSSSNEVKVPNA